MFVLNWNLIFYAKNLLIWRHYIFKSAFISFVKMGINFKISYFSAWISGHHTTKPNNLLTFQFINRYFYSLNSVAVCHISSLRIMQGGTTGNFGSLRCCFVDMFLHAKFRFPLSDLGMSPLRLAGNLVGEPQQFHSI